MTEAKLIYVGKPLWALDRDTKTISYVYKNAAGREVEIVVFDHSHNPIILYPQGIPESGMIYGSGRETGHSVDGLLSAQLEAIEILSHD